jgi:hypothetical protein
MNFRVLLVCCLAVTLSYLQAQIFSGMRITESQLADFVKPLRQLQPGKHTSDDVVQLIGVPHGKSDDGRSEVWNYGFLVTPDKEAAETANLERQITQLEKQRNHLWERQFDVTMESAFSSNDLSGESNQVSSALKQIEDRLEPLQARRREISFQNKPLQVNCDIVLDVNARIKSIEVSKFSEQGRQLVYSQAASANSNQDIVKDRPAVDSTSDPNPQASNVPPESPKLGQIYFNTTEKCFYGWNGTSWEKLSGGP